MFYWLFQLLLNAYCPKTYNVHIENFYTELILKTMTCEKLGHENKTRNCRMFVYTSKYSQTCEQRPAVGPV